MFKFFLRSLLFFLIATLILLVASKSLPTQGTIPVLKYHAIGSRQDAKEQKNYVSRESFSFQMAFLRYMGYRVLTIQEYERILNEAMPSRGREILITFDDANQTFQEEAWPILKRYSFPVTLFVVSENLKRQINNSLSKEDMKTLLRSGLVTLGSNSQTHASLPDISEHELIRKEIFQSKKDLEEILNVPVYYFSYPHGNLNAEILGWVKEAGYRLGFTTSYHQLRKLDESRYAITRLNVTRSWDNPIIFWTKVTGLYQTHKRLWYGFKQWLRSSRTGLHALKSS